MILFNASISLSSFFFFLDDLSIGEGWVLELLSITVYAEQACRT